MPNCSICYERFTSPVSLPCGHVFCKVCIRRTIDSLKSSGVKHSCPTCRASYSILALDRSLIPTYLRPHILPPIRPVFFDDSTPTSSPDSSLSSSDAAADLEVLATLPPAPTPAELVAESNALRLDCATWRRRAETHASASTTLLAFARAARDCALRMRAERDAERNKCTLLKRKLADMMSDSDSDSSDLLSSPDSDPKHRSRAAPLPRAGLPVFLMCQPPNASASAADVARFGPPLKRRKESPRDGVLCDDDDNNAASLRDLAPSADVAPESKHPSPSTKYTVRSIADLLG